ncbi:ABC transporter ATP-binding protein [Brucella gallinifaecis]|uniref:ABC transporter ATP-binding protein n=2 Tax=Pseudomonadota TaxID=1224 RepID=UPI002361E524|nr:ABC transporter ATP-binding protein [Brucella gallinifaecis]
MMQTLIHLLGKEAPVLYRYLVMVSIYGALSGLCIALTAPFLSSLFGGDQHSALPLLGTILAGALFCWFWRRRVEMAGVEVGIAVLDEGRRQIGDHIASLPVGWFNSENTAKLNHSLTHGVMEIAQLPAHVLTPVLGGLIVAPIVAITLCVYNWQMGLVAICSLPIMVSVFILAGKLGRQADIKWHNTSAQVSQRAVEFAQNQAIMRAFGGENSTRFIHDAIKSQSSSGLHLIRLSILSVVLNIWVLQTVFGLLLVLAISGLDMSGEQAIATVVTLYLANRFCEPLQDVAGYGEALRGARNQLITIAHFFAVKPLPEPDMPQLPIDSSVEFQNVSFCYPKQTTNAISNVSLKVNAGEMIAIIGSSGSGKSTLAYLIARFYDVDAGQILIGGVDVRKIASQTLSLKISQIFQKNWLFQGSIADNIRLGRNNANTTEIAAVAKLAGLDTMLTRLPDGFDTQVGENGSSLSGGERQRITIARALLKKAPILIVDEATASLDAENQAGIANAIASLRGQCTLIVIAHQLATIQTADRIVVLDNGRIIESGTPSELLTAQGGAYAQLIEESARFSGWKAPTI